MEEAKQSLAAVEKAPGVLESTGALTNMQKLRAKLLWHEGQRQAAIAKLGKVLDLAEQDRAKVGGLDDDRARFYTGYYSAAFEQMIAWQVELGNVADAFAAAERGRARTLEEQIDLRGVDLLAGLPAEQAAPLRGRLAEAESQVSALEARHENLLARSSTEGAEEQTSPIAAELTAARAAWREAWREVQLASPACRLAQTRDRQPLALADLQAWAAKEKAFVLCYVVGVHGVYVFSLEGNRPPRVEKISVAEDDAQTLGIEPGRLDANSLVRALYLVDGQQPNGAIHRLADPIESGSPETTALLHALWRVLVPEQAREALTEGRVGRLVVVPEEVLAPLPFEALVVTPGDAPVYLLDVGPPVSYAPSATMLARLAERPAATGARSNAEPIVTASYSGNGANGNRLAFAEVESGWVADVFDRNGVRVQRVREADCSEQHVRQALEGRTIIHLACHALTDADPGNYFAFLSLARGRQAGDPTDDGRLTLAEVYALDLSGCELAILSACETNLGSGHRGEGLWTLTRGFLVAGARRVAATNWRMDDEAAAHLVSFLSHQTAPTLGRGESPDYAAALQAAKRKLRNAAKHAEWRRPYYWAPMVLIGPN